MDLSIIIPVYNESKAIAHNFSVIHETLFKDKISCQYFIVDDGSTDDTWQELNKLKIKYHNVSAIRFARNFGKEVAICAGLDHIRSERYLIMDSDLQHPPSCVKEMLLLMNKTKANIIDGVKQKRSKETLAYKLLAGSFYKVLKAATGLNMNHSSDFKLFDNKVADAIRRFSERNLFFRGLVDWIGFKTIPYQFNVQDRLEGTTRFSTMKLIKLALNAIVAHTSKPLYLTIVGGVFFLIFAIILGIQTLVNFFVGNAISGFSTVILLLLIIGSMIMLSLGIIGVYISRIYDEVKQRPRYIIADIIGNTEEDTVTKIINT